MDIGYSRFFLGSSAIAWGDWSSIMVSKDESRLGGKHCTSCVPGHPPDSDSNSLVIVCGVKIPQQLKKTSGY